MGRYDELKEEISQMREKLNLLIENGASKDEIYAASVKLDDMFVELMKLQEK